MAKYIFSKLACDNAYTIWHESKSAGNQMLRKAKQVLVKGGAGVASKHLITPHGVMTEIEDAEYKLLTECPSFKRHVDGGFIKVMDKRLSEGDKKKAADDLSVDKSAPLTPEKLKKEGKKAGKTNKA